MIIMPEIDKSTAPRSNITVLGVPVSMINLYETVQALVERARLGTPSMIFVREVASLMAARADPALRSLHNDAYLVVPDGMPLVWIGRSRGFGSSVGRVAGADLLDAISHKSLETGQSHYFYGGKPGVAEEMARRLCARYPGLKVAGTFSPPIRKIAADFEPDASCITEIEQIRAANPDFIWVGISSPKQEFWMAQAAPLVGRGVFVGVGAAFDFHSGAKRRAPRWMQSHGLEWFHRLLSEPRRLWKRYLIQVPQFALLILQEVIRSSLRRPITDSSSRKNPR